MGTILRGVPVFLLVVLLQAPAWAQGGATVTGLVTDETGGVLPGVTVDLVAGTTTLHAVTDEQGAYRFDDAPAGPVELTFKLINFSIARRMVTAESGRAARADAVLTLSLTADVVVTGTRTFRNIADLENPAENLVGVASAASVGAITSAQLEARPIMRPAEVLESVPGLIASQHSGEGKANQYYLRGFNLDHGSDFATTLAGIPINMPSSAHFHGYSDTNLLIPELVSGVQYKKGPYFAEDGDFAAAGSANINYLNELDGPMLTVGGGGQGWGRIFAAASPKAGPGVVLAGLELARNDGPWERPDDLKKINGILRYTSGDTRNGFSVTGMGYSANWDATDQVPLRAIESGLIGRFGNLDPSDGGKTYRYSFAADAQRSSSNASTRVTAFTMRYGLNLFSNFTYFLDDPVNGDQIEQADRRWASGLRVSHKRLTHLFGRHLELATGAQLRHDAVDQIGLYRTVNRQRRETVRDDDLAQTSLGLFGQGEIEWSRVFRTTLGVRSDVFRYDVESSDPLNSGKEDDAILTPKFTAVLGPWQSTELYVNAGMGFHSNDARGTTIRVDPSTGEPVDPVVPLVRAKGAEIGMRTVKIQGLQSTVALWYLGFDSELLFIGDAGITEASRPSRRYGLEWANYARLNPWMTAELDLSFSRAQFTDNDPAGNFIPGALDRVVSAALTVEPRQPVFGSLRLRHFGPRPLLEDASVESESTTIWNGEIGYRFSERARISIEGFNLFDSDVSDIDYFYTSRLPGEPLEGVDGVHLHPSLPRSARVTLQLSF